MYSNIFDRLRSAQAAQAAQAGATLPAPTPILSPWFKRRFQLPIEFEPRPRPMPVAGAIVPRAAGGGGFKAYNHRDARFGQDSPLGDWTDFMSSAEGGEDTGPVNMGPAAPEPAPSSGGGILESIFSGFGKILGGTVTKYADLKSRELLSTQNVKTANAQYQARLAMPTPTLNTNTLLMLAAGGLGLYFIMRKK